MAKGGEGREGNALKTAVIVAGGLALAWVTVETAFRPFLDRLRAAVSRSTDPSRHPDEEDSAPAPAPAAPPAPAAAEVEEKAPAPAPASAEPSAPGAPEEEVEKVADKVAVLEEKLEETAAKAE